MKTLKVRMLKDAPTRVKRPNSPKVDAVLRTKGDVLEVASEYGEFLVDQGLAEIYEPPPKKPTRRSPRTTKKTEGN